MQNNSNYFNRKIAVVRNNERGFSLLEMIIAMVIFLIVTGAIYGVMQTALQSRSVVNEKTALTKNVRFALNMIGRDTYNAGYGYPVKNTVILPDNKISLLLGIPVDVDGTRDTVPPIIAGNGITTNTSSGILTDQVTFLFKDSTFNLVGSAAPTDKRVSQPLLAFAPADNAGIFEIAPTSGSVALLRINDLYLISGDNTRTLSLSTAFNTTATQIQFADGDVLGFNQTGAASTLSLITTATSIQRIRMTTYFVSADGILTRREYANTAPTIPATAFVDSPLVYGVENFQIQYVLENGTITDNPSAGPNGTAGDGDDTQSNLTEVRQIRFTINVRSTQLDAAGQPYRTMMTSTFSTRNLGYDAN
jgi:prepilin-type N-terminal cleavage/methylation domain-containing protein